MQPHGEFPAKLASGLTQAGLLSLQRTLGNQAVSSLLARPRRGRRRGQAIQRFEGPEHAAIGNATGIQIDLGDGVVLDWGQVVAMAGDEVGGEDELREWTKTPAGKAKIRAALEHAEVPGDAVRTLPAPSLDEKQAQETRYYLLALDNKVHFPSGGMALNAWREHHARALDTALRAGLANPRSSSMEINDAYLSEAFGQHFLTDMFSGSHIRTPRDEIIDWYVSTFAPDVIDSFILNLRQRLEDGIYRQISAQSFKARVFEGLAREKVRAALDAKIAAGISKLKGGKEELTSYFGKVVAGIVSGAIHDAEGQRGVFVKSAAHPQPWTALGDGQLVDPHHKLVEAERLLNEEQAQAAVRAGLRDVDRAYAIGQREGVLKEVLPRPDQIPSKVYFRFNSDSVLPGAQKSLDQAAAFLAYNPDTHVDLIGHTDPIGDDGFNLELGQRRADAASAAITSHAVAAGQVSTTSMGEKALAATDPRRYALDRRVEFAWSNQPAPPSVTPISADDATRAYERALLALQAEVGPPFAVVESLIPEAIPVANPDLPDWHWTSLSPQLHDEINDWVRRRFTKDLEQKVLDSDMLKEQTVEGYTIDPMPIVRSMLDEIKADPMKFLNGVFSMYLDPDDFSPD